MTYAEAEARLGAEMLEKARSEGHRRGLPPSPQRGCPTLVDKGKLIAFLKQGHTRNEIAARLDVERTTLDSFMHRHRLVRKELVK